MPESLEDFYGGIGGVVAALAEPGLVTCEVQQTAVVQTSGIGVVFLDQIVFRREQIDVDASGVDPLVDDALVSGVVAAPTGMGAREVLQAGDRGGPLNGATDGEDPAIDFDRMALVGAGFSEPGVRDRAERSGSQGEQSGDFFQTKDIAIEEEVSRKTEVAEGLEFEEGLSVPQGTALFVWPDVRVGCGIDEDAAVTMGEQKGMAEHLRFRTQDDDGERGMVEIPRFDEPSGAGEIERVGEHDEAVVGCGGSLFQERRNAVSAVSRQAAMAGSTRG